MSEKKDETSPLRPHTHKLVVRRHQLDMALTEAMKLVEELEFNRHTAEAEATSEQLAMAMSALITIAQSVGEK
jgi:hypothetical protein